MYGEEQNTRAPVEFRYILRIRLQRQTLSNNDNI